MLKDKGTKIFLDFPLFLKNGFASFLLGFVFTGIILRVLVICANLQGDLYLKHLKGKNTTYFVL